MYIYIYIYHVIICIYIYMCIHIYIYIYIYIYGSGPKPLVAQTELTFYLSFTFRLPFVLPFVQVIFHLSIFWYIFAQKNIQNALIYVWNILYFLICFFKSLPFVLPFVQVNFHFAQKISICSKHTKPDWFTLIHYQKTNSFVQHVFRFLLALPPRILICFNPHKSLLYTLTWYAHITHWPIVRWISVCL